MAYCVDCGTELIEKECFNCGESEGMVPYCPKCEQYRFPQFNSAVSTIIYNKTKTKILLIKQYGRDANILVAGFVSKGETLEEALIREIKEEVGLDISEFQFNESKYFEKSNSLISNFIVIAENENINCNSEVDFAKWYSIEEAKESILHNGLAEYFFLKSIDKVKFLETA